MEVLRLRIQGLDVERRPITVQSGKAEQQRGEERPLTDLAAGWGKVALPHSLARHQEVRRAEPIPVPQMRPD